VQGKVKPWGREFGDSNFDRYFNNKSCKKKPLSDRNAIEKTEQRILQQAISYFSNTVDAVCNRPCVNLSSPPRSSLTNIPLHKFNECGRGESQLMDLGTATLPEGATKEMWLLHRHRSDLEIQLRPGLRGRHTFSRGKLHDKTFEWRVVVDTRANHRAQYRFQVYELLLDEVTGFRLKSKIYFGATPHAAWSSMYEERVPDSRVNNGAELCGFNEPGMLDLLGACTSALHDEAIEEFTHRMRLDKLKARRL